MSLILGNRHLCDFVLELLLWRLDLPGNRGCSGRVDLAIGRGLGVPGHHRGAQLFRAESSTYGAEGEFTLV